IITVLFDHGAFSSDEIDHVKAVSFGVMAYSVGLVSFMLIKVLAPGFYSRQDTKTPVKIGVITLVLNMVFNIMLAPFIGYLGLALATSMSASCNAFLLYRQLKKEQVYQFSSMSGWFTLKCIAASIVMGASVLYLNSYYAWQTWHFTQQLLLLGALLLIAGFMYFLTLFILGVRLNTIKNVATTELN
ncbi:MAG: murein biosynthesis integral membrane protein MurJ, partial [Pseudoalteromonas sp.]